MVRLYGGVNRDMDSSPVVHPRCFTLKMGNLISFETLLTNYHTTRRHRRTFFMLFMNGLSRWLGARFWNTKISRPVSVCCVLGRYRPCDGTFSRKMAHTKGLKEMFVL
jgi:hypothetical protein